MKPNVIFLAVVTAMMVSCVDSLEEVQTPQKENLDQIDVSFNITPFICDEAETKTAYNAGTNVFQWSLDDIVGIFPSEGYQAVFPMSAGAGTASAVFDGGGWGLKLNASYHAYYPFDKKNFSSEDSRMAVPYSYIGQHLIFADSKGLVEIGECDFMVSGEGEVGESSVAFNFKHLGALCRLILTVPESGKFSGISLKADSPVFGTNGTYDANDTDKDGIISLEPNETLSSVITVLFPEDNNQFLKNEVLTMYFLLPPTDLTSSDLTLILTDINDNEFSTSISSKNIQEGRSYGWTVNDLVAQDTSYEVTVLNEGSLSSLLSQDIEDNVTSLKIKGYLNGNDIKYIRSLVTEKKLNKLDLTKTYIVEGGEPYYLDYRTENEALGPYMFALLPNLRKVIAPSTVRHWRDFCFANSTSIGTIVMPSAVEDLGFGCFSGCASLKTIQLSENLKSLSQECFIGCTRLTSLDIPNTVQYIGNDCFKNCTSLESIVIPEGVKELRGWFNGCSSLANVTLPKYSLTDIGDRSFDNCISLKSITIPNSVTRFDNFVFNNCVNLEYVKLSNSITKIGEHSFNNCTSLKSIVLPDNLVYIDYNAFRNCISLESITFPELLRTIAEWAFLGCKSLKVVNFSEGLTTLKLSCFEHSGIENLVLPNSLITMESGVFNSCKSLKSVVFGDGVKEIPYNSFIGCESLKSVVMADSITNIGDAAFASCKSLSNVVFSSNLKSLGPSCFADTRLINVVLPNTVETIEHDCFRDCHLLESITLGNSLKSLGNGCFINTKLTNVVLPNTVETIGSECFRDCGSLASISLPNSVESIGRLCFYECRSLRSIDIPSKVTKLEEELFNWCHSLTSITIPESVTNIGMWCFRNCDALLTITIPSQVTHLGEDCFDDNLKTLYSKALIAPEGGESCVNPNVPDGSSRVLYYPEEATGYDSWKGFPYKRIWWVE